MRQLAHAAEAGDKDGTIRGERLNQVGQIFALDRESVFHAFDGIVAQLQCAGFDFLEPSAKTAERERILLARVDDRDGQRRAELGASALGDDGKHGMRDRHIRRGPGKRRRDQGAFARHGF